MPLRNNTRFCVNHPDTQMLRNDGFNALIRVTKKGDKVLFNPSTGVPVEVYYCPTCGYVELYAASGRWPGRDRDDREDGHSKAS